MTDMAPGGVGAVAASHETWIGPPLDEEESVLGRGSMSQESHQLLRSKELESSCSLPSQSR